MPKKKIKRNRKKVIGYCRVSTDHQARHGISLAQQREAIASYCEMRGLELVDVICEAGSSAYKQHLLDRPESAELTQIMNRNSVGGIVALRLDRLFRSIHDCIVTVSDWDKNNISLHLIDLGGQSIDTSTPMGRMVITVLAGVGELESYHKAERMKDAWGHYKRNGKRLGGSAPYGYRVVEKVPVPVEREQVTINRIVQLRKSGVSLNGICRVLTDEGHRPRGKKWHITTVVRILDAAGTGPE